MAPAGWHALQPTGVAAAILGVAITFSILSTIVMSLRVFVRVRMGMFSTEDWLMCAGYVSAAKNKSLAKFCPLTRGLVDQYGTQLRYRVRHVHRSWDS